eukprot:COSAG01_NODE_16544_length_1227_cov_9.898050_1_plen_92_part_00
MAAEDANLRNWRFGTFGDLAARVRNYASRGRESANYGGAILLGLTALEWEEGAQHSTFWRFVTLYSIVSQTVRGVEFMFLCTTTMFECLRN